MTEKLSFADGKMYQVIVIGGGLGGLLSSILLARAGVSVLVIEKNIYPFHRVCGEYVSNEVNSYLHSIGLFPKEFSPSRISRLQLSSRSGILNEIKLPVGGFGISRFNLDNFWYQEAVKSGVNFQLGSRVSALHFENQRFTVRTKSGTTFESKVALGAFGKRSNLDIYLKRPFIKRRSGFVGVKYHLKYPWDPNLIALHGFKNGYCGISMIEDQKLNLCYLSSRDNLRTHGDLASLETHVLSENPFLASILSSSERLFEKPMVINEISFANKSVVDNHMLMVGDSAGMISPLCGNGMAMAIISAKILAPRIIRFFEQKPYTRAHMESDYQKEWKSNFSHRLTIGRHLQKLLYHPWGSRILVQSSRIRPLADWLIQQTHGKEL